MKKKILATLLSFTMMIGAVASPVFGGQTDRSEEAEAAVISVTEEETQAENEEEGRGEAEPEEGKEETVEEETAEESEPETELEEDSIETESAALETVEGPDAFLDGEGIFWDVTEAGKIQIRYQEYVMYPDLRFAVWSDEQGQDDLTWTNATAQADPKVYIAEFDPAKLKHYGKIHIHAYSGRSFCVATAEIEVGQPSIGNASVENLNVSAGTCDILLSDITHPELIKSVVVPVWSDPKQADIVWYTAEKVTGDSLEETSYRVSMKISRHNNNTGNYNIHVYLRDTCGKQVYQTKTEATFAISGSLSVEPTGDNTIYTAKVKNLVVPGGWTELRYAVWSEEKGQDDLKWTITGNTSLKIDLNKFKHLGLFNVHVYVLQKNGALKLVGETTFTPTVEEPVVELGDYSADGLLTVTVKNLLMQNAYKELRVAVWSEKNDQDDLKWTIGAAGATSVQVDLKKHSDAGQYFVHVYGVTTEGKMKFIGKSDDLVLEEPKAASISVSDVKPEEGAFTVKVVLPEDSLPVTRVQVPVWCASDQSDIKWYDATKKSDGSYQVTVKTSNHKEHAGIYQIHVYGTFTNGVRSFIGSTTQEMTPSSITVSKSSAGKRTVVIRNCSSAKAVYVPVWSSDGDQDDLVWYKASKNSNGVWQAVIDASNHRNAGEYQVHVYADNAFVGNTTFTLAYSEVKTEYTELAKSMKLSAANDQLILVAASGTEAQIVMLNKNSDGSWFQLLSSEGYVGSGGVGDTTEWNRKTPQGAYGFTMAFGVKADPGTAFDYVQVNSSHYWVDDVTSKYYNQFVSTRTVAKDWSSAEHLIDYTGSYAYCLALNYNPDCIPGVGSAIFLHCSSGRPTLGCISVPESVMIKIMQLVRTDCKIVINSKSGLASY